MRIVTWNVNSLKQRVPRLLPWLDERKPDVLCLQETKLADDAFAELMGNELSDRGYEVAAHGQGAWNGVAILSRVGLEDVIVGIEGARYTRASDEHGVIELGGPGEVRLGQKIRLVPGHCDPTVNLYDWLVCYRGERVEDVWAIAARGAFY